VLHEEMTDRQYLSLIGEQVDALLASKWANLDDACSDRNLRFPGVYILAHTDRQLSGKQVELEDIFHVGMSVSAGGVRQRLKQFKAGIERNCCHSGAMRFYRDHARQTPFSKLGTAERFYAAAAIICCERQSHSDWRDMGHVACLEFYTVAHVLEKTARMPKLNLEKTSASRAGKRTSQSIS
jgi:hypothetical protein